MRPAKRDVEAMVGALFALIGGIERASRRHPGASMLSLLQVLAESGPARLSEIAQRQDVHASLITRQIKELEGLGYVKVAQDPADGRAWLVGLTARGKVEMRRLQRIGVDRFAAFVADWDTEEVRTLTALLKKLEQSKATVSKRERDQASASRAQLRRASLWPGRSKPT